MKAPELRDVLRDRIARQEIAPGASLREQELSMEFNVPRSMIREVFSALEQRGLVERVPRRGTVVARLSLEEVAHIYDVREVLEGLCVRLATQNTEPSDWQDLVELFDGPVSDCVARGDINAFHNAYELFRLRVISAAANTDLTHMLDSIWDRTQVLIRRIILLPGRAQVGLAEHQAVLHAMRRGDVAAAEELRRANMRSAKQTFMKFRSYLL